MRALIVDYKDPPRRRTHAQNGQRGYRAASPKVCQVVFRDFFVANLRSSGADETFKRAMSVFLLGGGNENISEGESYPYSWSPSLTWGSFSAKGVRCRQRNSALRGIFSAVLQDSKTQLQDTRLCWFEC